MYFSAASNTYRAVNCDTNNYGVANITTGLAAYPCRDCPAGMMTSNSLAPSSNYYVSDSGKQGFTNPLACVTKAGYGYNGRVATKCPAGSYNAAGNYGTCTKCASGLSTVDDADNQVSASNCTLAVGYGFHDNAIVPCPVGECVLLLLPAVLLLLLLCAAVVTAWRCADGYGSHTSHSGCSIDP